MSKLGIYLCSYQQPVFLRHALLQILNQSRLPDVLAVHINASDENYFWVVEDVLRRFAAYNVQVETHYTPYQMTMPLYYWRPLNTLVAHDCDYYVKLDVDDIAYSGHFQSLLNMIEQSGHDYAMNRNSGLLVLRNHPGFHYKERVDFGVWNPTGAHPNNIIFNKAVAEEFLKQLIAIPNLTLNDDTILAKDVLPKFKGYKYDLTPTTCFVAHGKNKSVAGWSDNPPSEVL